MTLFKYVLKIAFLSVFLKLDYVKTEKMGRNDWNFSMLHGETKEGTTIDIVINIKDLKLLNGYRKWNLELLVQNVMYMNLLSEAS